MGAERGSLTELVARFSLRARARGGDYLTGRRLAESGAVTVGAVERSAASVTVVDGQQVYEVSVRVSGGRLNAACSCDDAPVCRHAVAAEHALWRQAVS
jgi:uncharacterized Zn finger protein